MNNIFYFFTFLFFIKLTNMCQDVSIISSLAENCLNFGNGTQQCFSKINGFITFTNKGESCVDLKVNNTIIGRIEMKILDIFFIPNCISKYWTYKHDKISNIETKTRQILLPINVLCNTIPEDLTDVCICNRNCKTSQFERFLQNKEDLLDRECYNQFTSSFYQQNKDDLTKYFGNTGCELKDIGLGTIQMFFYTYSFKPDFNKIYELLECSTTGETFIKLQMDFYDMSNINKDRFEKRSVFPNTTQIITFQSNKVNNQIFEGFTFINDVYSPTGGNFPISKYLINDKNFIDCYYLENGANGKNIFTNLGVGEIQTDNPIFINKLSTTKIKYSNQSTIITNTFVSGSSLLVDKSQLTTNGLLNFPSSSLINIGGQSIQKLPHTGGLLGNFEVNCLKRKIFSSYKGSFTYQLFFRMNNNYRFIQQTNEIIPKISNCRDLHGFKNSSEGSFITFDIESLTLKGFANMYLGDSNDNQLIKDIHIFGQQSFLIEKNIKHTYTLFFNIETDLQKVNITLIAVGTLGHNSSCSLVYYPDISHPDKTDWIPDTPQPTINKNCIDIFFTCLDTNNPFGFFKWFSDFWNDNSLSTLIIKIVIFSLIGLLILGILLCIFLPILNKQKNNFQQLPQSNIVINIPKSE